jgi:hypothetical protein
MKGNPPVNKYRVSFNVTTEAGIATLITAASASEGITFEGVERLSDTPLRKANHGPKHRIPGQTSMDVILPIIKAGKPFNKKTVAAALEAKGYRPTGCSPVISLAQKKGLIKRLPGGDWIKA